MRYGVLGGTFDPPHNGHIAIAQAAMEHLNLDEVIFIPANRNPLKRTRSASPDDRMAMTQLAIQDFPRFAVSDIEVSRGGRSFTVDTVEELQMTKPGQIWILMGADALSSLPEWRTPEKLLKLARIGVVVRPPHDLKRIISTLPEQYQDFIDEIPMRQSKISSSEVREMVEFNQSPEMWLDPRVWEYIKQRELYEKE